MQHTICFLGAQGHLLYLKVSPALRFIPMEKNRDARSDQGYKLGPVAQKTGTAAEK